MKKIINNPHEVVKEMVTGMIKANPEIIQPVPNTLGVVRADKDSMRGKVGLVSGGGAGHEPAHNGYVGNGMLTAAVSGQVFTSPTPDQIYEAIKAANTGQGVFLIIKNYSGDIMNFDMAKDLAELDDIPVKEIVVDDDIAVENSTFTQGKRGVAGTVLMHKILGAAAQEGASLDEIDNLAKKVMPNLKTIGLALTAATNPEVGKPGFKLANDEIEFGVGIHSEPGYRREKLKSSKDMADELVTRLNEALNLDKNKKYALLVNGMGATPLMEQYIFTNDVFDKLAEFNVKPVFTKIGNYLTSIDMAGISVTLLEIADVKWLDYLNYPVETIAW